MIYHPVMILNWHDEVLVRTSTKVRCLRIDKSPFAFERKSSARFWNCIFEILFFTDFVDTTNV
jgi:hypothetical protein